MFFLLVLLDDRRTGSVPLTNGSGFGRHKNLQKRNTALEVDNIYLSNQPI
jgi:hypothetical protein